MDVLNKLIIILSVLIGFGFLAFAQPADSTIRNVVARIDTTKIDDIIKDLSGEKPVVVEGKEYIINNRHIKSHQISRGETHRTIDVSKLRAGVYTFSISIKEKRVWTGKFSIVR